jgi:D-xylulose reductase
LPTTSSRPRRRRRVEHAFRYAHVCPRAAATLASGATNIDALIADRFASADGVEAFDYAKETPPTSVKA